MPRMPGAGPGAALAAALLLGAGAPQALADREQDARAGTPLETCLGAALAKKPGRAVKLEAKLEKGVLIYEFDIGSADGRAWDVECNTATGWIMEVEQELRTPDDPLFRTKSRLSEAQARRIALERCPGRIVEVEYEMEAHGFAAWYEFDIETADGRQMKVEVDSASGEIVEASEELYQIGRE